jgi:hypothetical protein
LAETAVESRAIHSNFPTIHNNLLYMTHKIFSNGKYEKCENHSGWQSWLSSQVVFAMKNAELTSPESVQYDPGNADKKITIFTRLFTKPQPENETCTETLVKCMETYRTRFISIRRRYGHNQ